VTSQVAAASALAADGWAAAARRTFPVAGRLDLPLTLATLRRGPYDPAHVVDGAGRVWRTLPTPEGPATLCLGVGSQPAAGAAGVEVQAAAWGAGRDWALAAAPALVGSDDEPERFRPEHDLLARLARRFAGLRIGRTGLVLDQVVPAVLEQKVTGTEAHRSWRELLRRFGQPAPGPAPAGMAVAPTAADWLAIPSWEWHRAGVDDRRARTIRAAATVAARVEECIAMSPADAARRLLAVPGIGPWTVGEVAARALGDADAVSVGDLHLPGLVGMALAGRPVDDARMLELLAPFRPHRQRVLRLVELSGVRVPRRAPRFAPRDYRAI